MASNGLTDIKVGKIIKMNDAPFLVVWSQFLRKQQRKPVVKTKLKNIITGATQDKTFLAGESFDFADVSPRKCQYLYKDKEDAYFMNQETYEQFQMPVKNLEDQLQYMLDGMELYVVFYEDRPVGVQPPSKVELKIVETPPGVKGDTATGGNKPATLETGLVVQVPLFLEAGQVIRVNTETGEYCERVSS